MVEAGGLLRQAKQFLFASLARQAGFDWEERIVKLAVEGPRPENIASVIEALYFPLTQSLKRFIESRICHHPEHSCILCFTSCPNQLGEELAYDTALKALEQAAKRYNGSSREGLSESHAFLNYLCIRAAGEVLNGVARVCRDRQNKELLTDFMGEVELLIVDDEIGNSFASQCASEEIHAVAKDMTAGGPFLLQGAVRRHLNELQRVFSSGRDEVPASGSLRILAALFSGRHFNEAKKAEIVRNCCNKENTFHSHQLRLRVELLAAYPGLLKIRNRYMGGNPPNGK